jgi:hypothetical protein
VAYIGSLPILYRQLLSSASRTALQCYNYCILVSTLELGRHFYSNYGLLLKDTMVTSYGWYAYEVDDGGMAS